MSSDNTLNMLLELDHISKIYGDLRAVDDLTLTVPQGEWLAIVGSSGSGKTTLMNMIGCMVTDPFKVFCNHQKIYRIFCICMPGCDQINQFIFDSIK